MGFNLVVGVLLSAAALYQAYRILPYTPVWKKSSRRAEYPDDKDRHLKMVISNVLQTNRDSDKVIAMIREQEPDLFLTVETNKWWEERLDEAFSEDYPYSVKIPLENLYGMHLYSKRELHDVEKTYRIKDDIPGIDARIQLGNGRDVQLYFVHPMPPAPSEAYASTSRDGELAMIGKQVKEHGGTCIVAGDLNDVAWSHSTRLFQRISGMLDPRRGRGLYATFHADYWIARWPLDHVFHTQDLALVSMERLQHVGSDHFPIVIEFSYEPASGEDRSDEQRDDDLEEADKTIHHAKQGKEDTVESMIKEAAA